MTEFNKQDLSAESSPAIPSVARRGFLSGVLASSAATTAATLGAQPVQAAGPAKPSVLTPSAKGAQAETGIPPDLGHGEGMPGSDFNRRAAYWAIHSEREIGRAHV